MKIGIDIDGVIADFVGSFLPKLNEICSCRFDQIVSHDFKNNICVDETLYKSLWSEEVDNGKIYKQLAPINGAQEALHRLAEKHEIIIISSRNKNSRTITKKWLMDWKIPFSRLELAKSKREKVEIMCDCDLIIEDELEIARMVEAKGVCVILFDYPWTHIGRHIKRVRSWNEIVKKTEIFEGRKNKD